MEYVLSILVMMNFWCTLMVPFVQAINAGQWRAKRWLWVYGLYHAALLSIPSYYTVHLELPIASGLIVMCEMVRCTAHGATVGWLVVDVVWQCRGCVRARESCHCLFFAAVS